MKTIEQWLTEYEASHLNEVNRSIHKIAVPSIVLSILMMLWPITFFSFLPNAALLVSAAALLYYAVLSPRLCFAMMVQTALMLGLIWYVDTTASINLQKLGLGIFVVAWIFQFIGHKIEGKKPSFFQDLVFLLIGPLWTLNTIFKIVAPSKR